MKSFSLEIFIQALIGGVIITAFASIIWGFTVAFGGLPQADDTTRWVFLGIFVGGFIFSMAWSHNRNGVA